VSDRYLFKTIAERGESRSSIHHNAFLVVQPIVDLFR
jgi:hypothetical protein